MKKSTRIVLGILVALLAILPLYLNKDAEFGGADGQAEEIVLEMNDTFEPLLEPLFEPASGEIESVLFALQAAAGAGVIFYYLGYQKGKRVKRDCDAA